jgi:hypothetical protein
MAGVPEILGPQEREREREMWKTTPQKEHLHYGGGGCLEGPQSQVGNSVPGTRVSCDLTLRFSRK